MLIKDRPQRKASIMPKQKVTVAVVTTLVLLVVGVIDKHHAFFMTPTRSHSSSHFRKRISSFTSSSSSSSSTTTINESEQEMDGETTISITPSNNHHEEKLKHIHSTIMKLMEQERPKVNEYTSTLDYYGPVEVATYSLFQSLRSFHSSDTRILSLFGINGHPFVLRNHELESIIPSATEWTNFFTTNDLQIAVQEDFLDAVRGSTDQRKGWKV
jgi:hypothetical protein